MMFMLNHGAASTVDSYLNRSRNARFEVEARRTRSTITMDRVMSVEPDGEF